LPDTTSVDKPNEKGRIGGHAGALVARGKAEATKVARTAASSEKDEGGTHVC
jgi:hypothetical protein